MSSIMEWFLGKMKLVDDEEIEEVPEVTVTSEKEQGIRIFLKKTEREPVKPKQVLVKKVCTYEDGKQVIEAYRLGVICVFLFPAVANSKAQGIMNYICGGIYALRGEVESVGENVFLTVQKE